MAAFSSLPSAVAGGLNPFHAIWAPLLGAAVSQTRGRPAAGPVALPSLPTPPPASAPPPSPSPASPPSASPAPDEPAPPAQPSAPSADGGGDGGGAADPSAGTPPSAPAERLDKSADRRPPGRTSLITTSLRGVLTPRPSGLTRKTLLGE